MSMSVNNAAYAIKEKLRLLIGSVLNDRPHASIMHVAEFDPAVVFHNLLPKLADPSLKLSDLSLSDQPLTSIDKGTVSYHRLTPGTAALVEKTAKQLGVECKKLDGNGIVLDRKQLSSIFTRSMLIADVVKQTRAESPQENDVDPMVVFQNLLLRLSNKSFSGTPLTDAKGSFGPKTIGYYGSTKARVGYYDISGVALVKETAIAMGIPYKQLNNTDIVLDGAQLENIINQSVLIAEAANQAQKAEDLLRSDHAPGDARADRGYARTVREEEARRDAQAPAGPRV